MKDNGKDYITRGRDRLSGSFLMHKLRNKLKKLRQNRENSEEFQLKSGMPKEETA